LLSGSVRHLMLPISQKFNSLSTTVSVYIVSYSQPNFWMVFRKIKK